MKKIGKEVLFIKAEKGALRNGEGAFFRTKDNTLMLVYTEFCGDDWHDHCEARLCACFSYDDGETWGDKRVIATRDEGCENIMSASLLRMPDGDIGLFYGQKVLKEDGKIYDGIYMRRSSDEGKTWSKPQTCIEPKSYWCLCNDRVLRLKSGRIIFPMSEHKHGGNSDPEFEMGTVSAFYSDDEGVTWHESQTVHPPFENLKFGLMEPGLYEREDGTLHLYIRTELGHQYECFSKDGGETWSSLQPNLYFASPDSPMLIKKVGGKYTVAVFNPCPRPSEFLSEANGIGCTMHRTPYLCAVSRDDGKTFGKCFYVEDDPENFYCYGAIIEGKDYFLIGYYHSNDTNEALNSLKVVKIMYDELEIDK